MFTEKLSYFLLCWCGYFVLQEVNGGKMRCLECGAVFDSDEAVGHAKKTGHGKFSELSSEEMEQERADALLAMSLADQEMDGGDVNLNKVVQCQVCHQYFESGKEAQIHALTTGHTDFSEPFEAPKKLTEKEKQEKFEEEQKLRAAQKEEFERTRAFHGSKIRRSRGLARDADVQKYKQLETAMLTNKILQNKKIEQEAIAKVRRQIKQDRAKWTQPQPVVATQPPPKESTGSSGPVRLQVRCIDGSRRTATFQPTDTFEDALKEFKMSDHTLMSAFPKKVIYTSEDHHKTLKDLGLTPSAVLIQTPPQE